MFDIPHLLMDIPMMSRIERSAVNVAAAKRAASLKLGLRSAMTRGVQRLQVVPRIRAPVPDRDDVVDERRERGLADLPAHAT